MELDVPGMTTATQKNASKGKLQTMCHLWRRPCSLGNASVVQGDTKTGSAVAPSSQVSLTPGARFPNSMIGGFWIPAFGKRTLYDYWKMEHEFALACPTRKGS